MYFEIFVRLVSACILYFSPFCFFFFCFSFLFFFFSFWEIVCFLVFPLNGRTSTQSRERGASRLFRTLGVNKRTGAKPVRWCGLIGQRVIFPGDPSVAGIAVPNQPHHSLSVGSVLTRIHLTHSIGVWVEIAPQWLATWASQTC